MSEKRKTFRHRNSPGRNHWMAEDLIFTYWVGQRVVRTWERKNYTDLVGELGTVTALPAPGSTTVTVLTEATTTRPAREAHWGVSECRPVRDFHARNARRLREVADTHRKALTRLDADGQLLDTTRAPLPETRET